MPNPLESCHTSPSQERAPERNTFSSFCENLSDSFAHSLIGSPRNAIAQTVNQIAQREVMSIQAAPREATPYSSDWIAQQIGGGLGTALPFIAVGAVARFGQVRGLLASTHTAQLRQQMLVGGLYGGLLTPVEEQHGLLVKQKILHAVSGAFSFGAMERIGCGLNVLSRSRLAPIRFLTGSSLLNHVGAGAANGLITTDIQSYVFTGHAATNEQRLQCALSFALLNTAMLSGQRLLGLTPAGRPHRDQPPVCEQTAPNQQPEALRSSTLTSVERAAPPTSGSSEFSVPPSRNATSTISVSERVPIIETGRTVTTSDTVAVDRPTIAEQCSRLTNSSSTSAQAEIQAPGAGQIHTTDVTTVPTHDTGSREPIRITTVERPARLTEPPTRTTVVPPESEPAPAVSQRAPTAQALPRTAAVVASPEAALNRVTDGGHVAGTENVSSVADNPYRNSLSRRRLPKPSSKPENVHFAFIRETDHRLPDFDLGVGVTEPLILDGRRSLAAEQNSLTQAALSLPAAEVPPRGSVLAAMRFDRDTFTALAILANRAEGRSVHRNVVDQIVQNDARGRSEIWQAVEYTIRSPNLSSGEKVRFIRALIDGTLPRQAIVQRARNLTQASLAASETSPPGTAAISPAGVTQALPGSQPRTALNESSLARHDTPIGESLAGSDLTSGTTTAHLEPIKIDSGNVKVDLVEVGFRQVNRGRTDFDIAFGISDSDVSTGKLRIDAVGRSTILDIVLALPRERFPTGHQTIGIMQHDTQRIMAAAIMDLRAQGMRVQNTPLLDLIRRNGQLPELIPAEHREANVRSFCALNALSNAPNVPLMSKIVAAKRIFLGRESLSQLSQIASRYALHNPATQPLQYVRTTQWKPKPFDFGVEITDPRQQKPGRLNLDHHGVDATAATPSAVEQALALPDEQMPRRGQRIGIEKPDADSLSAVAVLANRIDGLPVNRRLVEAIGLRDRGIAMELEQGDRDIMPAFDAIRSFARNSRLSVPQRITAIREILAGAAQQRDLVAISENLQRLAHERQAAVAQQALITEVVPGQLICMEVSRELYFAGRQLGQARAPVTLISIPQPHSTAMHFEVVARIGDPAVVRLKGALEHLQQLESGWGGRAEIFVSPSNSRLSRSQVLDVLRRYLEPVPTTPNSSEPASAANPAAVQLPPSAPA